MAIIPELPAKYARAFIAAALCAAMVFAMAFLPHAALGAADQITFLNQLQDRKKATVEDAVTLYMHILGKPVGDFKKNVEFLKNEGILRPKKDYTAGKVLRRGLLSGMVARHLKLKDSLFYAMVPIDRYALRACIAGGIMDQNTSEFDPVSGEELIEVMAIVNERTGGGR